MSQSRGRVFPGSPVPSVTSLLALRRARVPPATSHQQRPGPQACPPGGPSRLGHSPPPWSVLVRGGSQPARTQPLGGDPALGHGGAATVPLTWATLWTGRRWAGVVVVQGTFSVGPSYDASLQHRQFRGVRGSGDGWSQGSPRPSRAPPASRSTPGLLGFVTSPGYTWPLLGKGSRAESGEEKKDLNCPQNMFLL